MGAPYVDKSITNMDDSLTIMKNTTYVSFYSRGHNVAQIFTFNINQIDVWYDIVVFVFWSNKTNNSTFALKYNQINSIWVILGNFYVERIEVWRAVDVEDVLILK